MRTIKTLLITYYWPPSSGGGVMRWMKMSKYWNDGQNELIVFTPDLKDYPAFDETLLNQIPDDIKVIKNKIWEPHNLYKKFTGKKSGYSGFIKEKGKVSWKDKLSVWIRSNLFIPDARKFWIKPSIRFLVKYLRDNPVDVIISTGPPHSLHLIAMGVRKKINVKWIADFRDPWTDIDYAEDLVLTSYARKKHERLEKAVLESAEKVVTVSLTWQRDLGLLGSRSDVELITNGYDPTDFEGIRMIKNEKFSICHLGSMNAKRNPINLWKVLHDLCNENEVFKKQLEIKLIGHVDVSIIDAISEYRLSDHLVTYDFLPHKMGLDELFTSDVLLLPINVKEKSEGIIPGKVYEYLATNKPILALGSPDSDIKEIIKCSPDSKLLGYDSYAEIKLFILFEFEKAIQGKKAQQSERISQFSRNELAAQYKILIKNLVQT